MITTYNVVYANSSKDVLYLGNNIIGYYPEVYDRVGTVNNSNINDFDAVTFTPQAAAVPGPLPILGAASALGWSRRVRSRPRNAQRSAR